MSSTIKVETTADKIASKFEKLKFFPSKAGVGVGLSKNNVLNTTAIEKLSSNIKKLGGGGTRGARALIDSFKTSLVVTNKTVNDKSLQGVFTHAANLISSDPVSGFDNAMQLINSQLFLAFDEKSTASGASLAAELKATLNATMQLFGARSDNPTDKIVKIAKSNGYKSIDLLEVESDDNTETDYFFVKNAPLSVPNIKQEIREIIENTVQNISPDADTIYNAQIPTAEVMTQWKNKYVRQATVRFVYKYAPDDIALEYLFFIVKFNLVFTLEEDDNLKISARFSEETNDTLEKNSQILVKSSQIRKLGNIVKESDAEGAPIKSADVIEYEDDKEILKVSLSQFNIRKAGQASNIPAHNKLLNLERLRTNKGVSIFQYGHLISAGTVKIATIYNAVKTYKFAAEQYHSSPNYKSFTNIVNTLGLILTMSYKVDSIIENIYTPGVEGLTQKDIIEILRTESLSKDFSIDHIYMFEKKGALNTTPTKIERQVQVSLDENEQKKEIIAVMERGKFNAVVKAWFTKELLSLLRKQATSNFEEILTEEKIIQYLVEILRGSDTLKEAALKQVVGLKIDKGKTKSKKVKVKLKRKIVVLKKMSTTPDAFKNIAVPAYKPIKKNKKTAIRSSVKSNAVNPTVSKARQDKTSIDIVGIVNSQIQEALLGGMKHPALQNRSGKFRNSVKALSLFNNELSYTYMRDPYEVFSSVKGRSPWNTPARDPEALIEQSIRTILRKYAKNKVGLKGV